MAIEKQITGLGPQKNAYYSSIGIRGKTVKLAIP